jgi:hypothetical protein
MSTDDPTQLNFAKFATIAPKALILKPGIVAAVFHGLVKGVFSSVFCSQALVFAIVITLIIMMVVVMVDMNLIVTGSPIAFGIVTTVVIILFMLGFGAVLDAQGFVLVIVITLVHLPDHLPKLAVRQLPVFVMFLFLFLGSHLFIVIVLDIIFQIFDVFQVVSDIFLQMI